VKDVKGVSEGRKKEKKQLCKSVDLCIKKLLLLLGRGFAWEESEDSLRGKEEETQVLLFCSCFCMKKVLLLLL